MQLRRTILALFGPEAKTAALQMWSSDAEDWSRHLPWLYSSGMGLYLLRRMQELEIEFLLPAPLHARLQQNLADNACRTECFLAEMADLTSALNRAGIPFAFLKGLSLVPHSVPDPTLRPQSDLDIVASHAHRVGILSILDERGYILHADGNGTSEFKTRASRLAFRHEIHRVQQQRAIEVHWVPDHESQPQRRSVWPGQLTRTEIRTITGLRIPCLSSVDQLLNQALHLVDHLRSEHTRASWVVEFARHVDARNNDVAFWEGLKSAADDIPQARQACAVCFALVERTLLASPPARVASWIGELSDPLMHWIDLYGVRTLTTEAPGSKLYLLLEAILSTDPSATRKLARHRLLPHRPPPKLMHPPTGESLSGRICRYGAQLWFISYRFRFHIREFVPYWIERLRWGKWMSRNASTSHAKLQRNDNQATAV